MTRSCGIRIGPRRYELVVLDGGVKKHKIAAYSAGELPAPSEEDTSAAVDILKEAARAHRVPRENIYLAIDTGNAAFRHLSVPFSDRAKIAQVVKFEVEGQLPQWSIDDIVVDFHVLRGTDQSSDLLVSAVPKGHIGAALEICERAGVEPLDAELETSAMVNAAVAGGLCPPEEALLLIHVGEFSTSVVLVDGGEVRDMRVIHLGGLTHETLIASSEESELAEAQNGEEAPAGPPALDPIEIGRRIDQTIKRVRRELGRTISASQTVQPLTGIYVCGMDLPGLIGSSVLDIPVRQLDCFDPDGGQPAEGFGALVIAYGASLRGLGSVPFPASLRREELRYSGAVERIEFPFAVAALLLCFLLGVGYILQYREKEALQGKTWYWALSSINYLLGEPIAGRPGNLTAPPVNLEKYLKQVKADRRDSTRTAVQTLEYIKGELQKEILRVNSELGKDGAIKQPQSAFVATCLVLDLLFENEKEWRPSIRQLTADYVAATASGTEKRDMVKVKLDATFFAPDDVAAARHIDEFKNTLRTKIWCVGEPEFPGSKPIEGNAGLNVTGIEINVDVDRYFDDQHKLAKVQGAE